MGILTPWRHKVQLAETTPRPDTKEYGDTGMGYAIGAGVKGVALTRRLRALEYNYQLYESRGIELYDRMRFSDPKVAGLLRAMRLPIQGAQIHIESPFPEQKDPEYTRGQEIADFVSDNLLHGLADTWRATLYQFLLYLCHGFAPFEICWKVEDGKYLIDRFAYRPPSTIASSDIFMANGRIDHIHQVTASGTAADIPGEKLLWFCHEREGDNWRGTPLLRPMFKPWYAKEKLEIQTLIATDHGNGTPVVTAPEGGWGLDENGNSLSTRVDSALAAFCVSEMGYFNLPYGAQFQLVVSNASIAELVQLKASFEQDMSNVAIAQFLDLGQTPNGSRALGMSMSDMFLDSLSAIAVDIEDTINADGGPIHQLVTYNFAGSDDLVPSLRFGSISKLDLKTLALAFLQLQQTGMPFGEEVWEWIREELDLPARKAEEPSAQQSPTPGAAPASPSAVPPTAPPAAPPQPPTGAAPTAASELALAEGYWRARTPLECYVDLADIAKSIDEGPAAVRTATQKARNSMIAELVRRAQQAIATGDAAKVAALVQTKPPMVDKLSAAIRGVFRSVADAGAAQVRDELARQKAGKPVIEQAVAKRQGQSISAAARAHAPAPSAWVEDLSAYISAQAEISARQIAYATQAAVAAEAMHAMVAKVSTDVFNTMVTRASDEAALKAGLTVSHVMATGRAVEARANREQISLAFWSAILDDNTCLTCEERDGTETTDLDEAATWLPGPPCEGDERCRCQVFYEYKEEAPEPGMAEALFALAEVVAKAPAPIVNVTNQPAEITVNLPEQPAPIVQNTFPAPESKPRHIRREAKFLTDETGRIVGKTETETEE